MAIRLADLVDPAHTAVVTQECQVGVIGDEAVLPALAEIARSTGMIDAAARVCATAREVGIRVVHCVAEKRADLAGSNRNARLFAALASGPNPLVPGSTGAAVLPELGPDPEDLVLSRLHGLGPMGGTDLDPVLRNLGVRTVVGVGVSVNVGMLDLAINAVNAGYQVVLPRDALAGIPADYADQVFEHTLSMIATVTTTADLLAVWAGTEHR